MAAPLKTFIGYTSRNVPGLERHRRQQSVAVAATSRKGVLAALRAAGIIGWSLYGISTYWTDGSVIPETTARPGVVFWRPMDAHRAPWVPWDQEYPLDQIPDRLREGL
jgi:hypothetical protein